MDRFGEMVRNITYTLYCANTKKENQVSIQQWQPMFKDLADKTSGPDIPSWAETPREMRNDILKTWNLK
jgi:hypothetical protein